MHWIFSCRIKPIILYRYVDNNNKIYQADKYTTKQSRKLIREINVQATYWFLFQSLEWWRSHSLLYLKHTPAEPGFLFGAEVVKKPSNPQFVGVFKNSAKVIWPCMMQCAFPRLQGAEGHWEGLTSPTKSRAERTEPPKAIEPSGCWPQTSLIPTKADQAALTPVGGRAG